MQHDELADLVLPPKRCGEWRRHVATAWRAMAAAVVGVSGGTNSLLYLRMRATNHGASLTGANHSRKMTECVLAAFPAGSGGCSQLGEASATDCVCPTEQRAASWVGTTRSA